jgi:predicted phosphoadenosine phosphosulfate sulfurtransferase
MKAPGLEKTWMARNVLECARERFRMLHQRFDTVVVSFSGGKDSTVCLHLALEAAEAAGKLPVHAYFWDEEAIHPETIEYVERVRARPDVKLIWLCLPVKHRNACSRQVMYWYCWDPEQEPLWCRPMPEGAIREAKWFRKGMTIPEASPFVYGREYGTVCDVRGIRADESLRRLMSVMNRMEENWLAGARNGHNYPASPIYDWSVTDVWTAPLRFGWDYNRTYDLLYKVGVPLNDQRVCPPFGEEPLGALYRYAICWPDLWDKMVKRVPGAATAARYSRTELYGFGGEKLPEGVTGWREWTERLLALYPSAYRSVIANNIASIIRMHKGKTARPIPETHADPLTGLSWRFMANIVMRGDLKGRRKGKLNDAALTAMEKTGLTLTQLHEMERDGATRY